MKLLAEPTVLTSAMVHLNTTPRGSISNQSIPQQDTWSWSEFSLVIHGVCKSAVVLRYCRLAISQLMHHIPSHIHTYGGQGVTKKGLSAAHIEMHTVIYMQGTSPKPRADEIGMTKEPIAVKPCSPKQKLDPMSRLNFGKVYTVEHNIKAMDVGMVTDQSKLYLDGYFRNVFDDQRNSTYPENATRRRN
jgi:hypothetical protein